MKWIIDPAHSCVEFAVRHMGITTVRGRFKNVTGVAETADSGDVIRIEATIEVASIDTGEAQRDAHLISADFLDASTYPRLVFCSTGIDHVGDGRYHVRGNLTIRNETRFVSFDVEAANPVTDPTGNRRAGATAVGKLSRMDWNLTWNRYLKSGIALVGDDVRFTLDVQAVAVSSTQGSDRFAPATCDA